MAYEIDPQHVIADEAALRSLFGTLSDLARQKSRSALDRHSEAFIRRAPFLCIGTQNGAGRADVSPRGDPPGFVRILDPTTIAIPDRPGNNRLDTLANIVANPNVGLIFIIPGFEDTLRINGRARLVTAPDLLADMAVDGRVPRLAILVEIEEVFLHCAKAFRRSKLWDPTQFQDRSEMPSLARMILDQTTGAPEDPVEMRRIDDGLEESYRKSMY